MENYIERGVFLSSDNLDSRILLNCLHSLVNDFPSIRFTSITTDDKFQGFRVLFSGPDANSVFHKKLLTVDEQIVPIYPLTAVLTIHSIGVHEHPLFADDVLQAICGRFGKVLDVIKFSSDVLPNDLDTNNKLWNVRVDVPEFEGFLRDPEMILSLPTWNKHLRVTFWCRHCKTPNHFQHNCPKGIDASIAVKTECMSSAESVTFRDNSMLPRVMLTHTSAIASAIRSAERASFKNKISPPEPTDCFAENTQQQNAKKHINPHKENKKSKKSKSTPREDQRENSDAVKKIKMEYQGPDDECRNKKNGRQDIKMENSMDSNSSFENQFGAEEDVRRFMSYEEDTNSYLDSSSTDDSECGKSVENTLMKSDLSSVSPQSKIKEKPKAPAQPVTAARAGPSNTTSAASGTQLGAADTSILSDELQNFINEACETCRALDRQTLDAFLGYVKKKNKPTQIARKYTENVQKVKQQLQMILNLRYHNIPTNQTKEDATFIKWLEGLVSRFDNDKPSKRKRET